MRRLALILVLGSSALAVAQSQLWAPTLNGPLYDLRYRSAAVLYDGTVLLVGGGVAEAERFDPRLGRFEAAGVRSIPAASPTATVLSDGRVLVVGGVNASRVPFAQVDLFDPQALTWSAGPPLNVGRGIHTATLLPDGRVLVVGGELADGRSELYQPDGGSWAVTGKLAQPREGQVTMALPDGGIMVAGGWINGGPASSVELFDSSSGTFRPGSPLPAKRDWATGTVLPGGQVVVAGGMDVFGGPPSNSVLRYLNGSWTSFSMPTARSTHTATLLPNGSLLLAGGLVSATTPTTSAVVLGQASTNWASAPAFPMSVVRTWHVAALLPDGRVLISGGAAELFDPRTPTHALGPSMLTARYDASATVLPDGSLLVVGGTGETGTLLSAERKVGNSWVPAPSAQNARANHTATLLFTGEVLVVGGVAGTSPVQAVESFNPAATPPSWTSRAPIWCAPGHTATLLPSGQVLAVGCGGGAAVYDPKKDAWTEVSKKMRHFHSATLLLDGRVFVVGGLDGAGGGLQAELYDPTAGTWAPIATPGVWPGHAAALLPSGRVLIAGIENLYETYLFDPAAEVLWSPAAPLSFSRRSAKAIVLPGGQVVITDNSQKAPELYEPSTNRWKPLGTVLDPGHALALLPDGRVAIVGAQEVGGARSHTSVIDEGRKIPDDLQPVLTSVPNPINPGELITLQGQGLMASEGSSGDFRNASTALPLLQLIRQDNGAQYWARPLDSLAASPVFDAPDPLPGGWYWARVVVSGRPSVARAVQVAADQRYTLSAAVLPWEGSLSTGTPVRVVLAVDRTSTAPLKGLQLVVKAEGVAFVSATIEGNEVSSSGPFLLEEMGNLNPIQVVLELVITGPAGQNAVVEGSLRQGTRELASDRLELMVVPLKVDVGCHCASTPWSAAALFLLLLPLGSRLRRARSCSAPPPAPR